MTDERADRTRRAVLAGVGTVAAVTLAGCSALPWRDDSPSASFGTETAAEVIASPAPEIERPTPIDPGDDAFRTAIERADALLADVPETITAAEIPNGVVRESIADERDAALEDRADAADATGLDRYAALRTLWDARESAREAAVAYAAIDADRGRLVDDLESEHEETRAVLSDRLESIAYLGEGGDEGRDRAALVAAQREDELRRARSRPGRWSVTETDTVLDLGEAAGGVEFAAATAADWDVLRERYESSLADPIDLEPVFRDALDATVERIEETPLPDRDDEDWIDDLVDREVDETLLELLLYHAAIPATSAAGSVAEDRSDGNLGSGLEAALTFEQAVRALETVRTRVEEGDVGVPDSATEIRRERAAAIDAAEEAAAAVTPDSLGELRLADTLRSLHWIDERVRRRIERTEGDESTVSLRGDYRDYVQVRAELEALPDAVAAFRERVESV